MPGRQIIESKEEAYTTERDVKIMLKLADLLFQDSLITPEEKFRLIRLIRRGDSV